MTTGIIFTSQYKDVIKLFISITESITSNINQIQLPDE